MNHVDGASWHNKHHERVAELHKKTNNWQTQPNKRVAEFHKAHAAKIEAGENGNGLLARWERFVYTKGKALFKRAK
ncbi:hypothetical protein PU629_02445 [Pullulanibacillus sp. KACC 23026]|uniref:hypothetical protein n=1 Tax=Pullulanibacillus sp. KACC 23026 TaxID=3028315 RepID=UPI0023B1DF5B|nr:hypothetical protein [Pullulanibacillus sp. KACC 23026]WEG13244.1 hypothetical protein PU629_02445 [Pullulanibacillus sp. KACC 23026]